MKKKLPDRRKVHAYYKKKFQGMRLYAFFTLFLVCLMTIPSFAQSKRVSLDIKSEALSKILITIKNASGERIIFNENQLATIRKENISFENLPVKEAIDRVLRETDFKCELLDGVYVIKRSTKQLQVKSLNITGQVVDIKKNPLPGVTVRVKNTAIGVSTDLNGKYTLSLAEGSENLTLVFSFVGMESQEIGYTGKNVINVTLKENAVEMDEVVITGMFARKTESFTG